MEGEGKGEDNLPAGKAAVRKRSGLPSLKRIHSASRTCKRKPRDARGAAGQPRFLLRLPGEFLLLHAAGKNVLLPSCPRIQALFMRRPPAGH